MSGVEPTIDPTIVLVVANETLVGVELLDAVRRRAEKGPIRAVVVAPVNDPQSGYVVYQLEAGLRRETRRPARRGPPGIGHPRARRRVRGRADSRGRGHPRARADRRADRLDAPARDVGWLRKRNVLDELRKLAGDRPFEHVVSDVAARTGQANVLVIANETVIGDRLLDRLRARAAESPATFLVVSPQSDPDAGEHPEAERRLRAALATLRAEGSRPMGRSRTRTRTRPRCRCSRTSASTR